MSGERQFMIGAQRMWRAQRRPSATRTQLTSGGFGFLAGLRSQLPLALLATAANGGRFAQNTHGALSLLRSRGTLATLTLAANGEMIADKLPFTPSRIARPALYGRLLMGGIVGAVVAHEARQSTALGALSGIAGATTGAYAGYAARHTLGQLTGFPDFVWAVSEDALALGLGLSLIRPYFK
jgi:uncharacterized membrane protein